MGLHWTEHLFRRYVRAYNKLARQKRLKLYRGTTKLKLWPMSLLGKRPAIFFTFASEAEEERFRADFFLCLAEFRRPYAELGYRRSLQTSQWAKSGNAARRKYTRADKIRWHEIARTLATKMSKRGKAAYIARQEKLPSAATETIRKSI